MLRTVHLSTHSFALDGNFLFFSTIPLGFCSLNIFRFNTRLLSLPSTAITSRIQAFFIARQSLSTMAAVTTAEGDAKGFEYFVEIVNAFREAKESADGDDVATTKVEPFLNAMTMFLRIFDAFANPFFADVVKKDVQTNIKVRAHSVAFSRPAAESNTIARVCLPA